ncbi:MAG: hypothetical protein ACYDED_08120 [Ferrimicrobium sp.]
MPLPKGWGNRHKTDTRSVSSPGIYKVEQYSRQLSDGGPVYLIKVVLLKIRFQIFRHGGKDLIDAFDPDEGYGINIADAWSR